MNISIRRPIGYSQIGRKENQEDAVWPAFPAVTAADPCIVVCDGVGGSDHGEVASQNASRVIGEYLTQVVRSGSIVGEAAVQTAVGLAYDELDGLEGPNIGRPHHVPMATTLTCVCMHAQGIATAHMGDSRIYHVRPGQGILYRSNDHSLVNALVQNGEITPEEAKTHPRRNVITRAIQSGSGSRMRAEVCQLTDILPGDYLFLCTDGVLERLTEERLVEVLSLSCSDAEKLYLLQDESLNRTNDNYTAYLVPIDAVDSPLFEEAEAGMTTGEQPLLEDDDEELIFAPLDEEPTRTESGLSVRKMIIGLAVFLLLAVTFVGGMRLGLQGLNGTSQVPLPVDTPVVQEPQPRPVVPEEHPTVERITPTPAAPAPAPATPVPATPEPVATPATPAPAPAPAPASAPATKPTTPATKPAAPVSPKKPAAPAPKPTPNPVTKPAPQPRVPVAPTPTVPVTIPPKTATPVTTPVRTVTVQQTQDIDPDPITTAGSEE